jgi:hypothetical protein
MTIPVASNVAAGFAVAIGVLLVGCSVICAMKGKWWVALLGFIVNVIILVWPICAIRLAKPESFWARRWYDDETTAKARLRFDKSSERRAEKKERMEAWKRSEGRSDSE